MTAHNVSRESLPAAAEAVLDVVRGVADAAFATSTPCQGFDLKALINHFIGTTTALVRVGRREALDSDDPYGAQLNHTGRDWQGELSENISELAKIWSDPAAWEGSVDMGGGTMPATMIGEMVLAEIVLHGWDLARATGQVLELPESASAELRRGIEDTAAMGRKMGAYGPEVLIPEKSSEFDRALAASGRNPAWSAVSGQ